MEGAQPQSLPWRPIDRYGPKLVEKADKLQRRVTHKSSDGGAHDQPAGGFDATPIPNAPPGYTLHITFHRAVNLPFADLGSLSSDPYVYAQLLVDLPRRHKDDPVPSFRTPTVHKSKNPLWESAWIVANVPASGFLLKAYVYDEDPADHDDKLGVAFIELPSLQDDWPGIQEQSFMVKKRYGSKRVYLHTHITAFATGHHPQSFLMVSIECLGRTPGDKGGQVYTVGPNYWFKHFSPLIGRLAGTKEPDQRQDGRRLIGKYNFQAIQMQLQGPVPPELRHRYVEFKPYIAGMFKAKSARGRILHKALHHQHQRIYNFDRTTVYGVVSAPCREFAQKFLEFIHYGQGGRVFTFVLTLDGQFRFTETGKEFGIDLLSKHTMHSAVSTYVAYSGEFFLRQRKHRPRRHSQSPHPDDFPVDEGGDEVKEISTEPSDYELFIDNTSGTYRPNAEKLPLLKGYIAMNFPGLHVTTLDCQKDAERLGQMKDEQRGVKQAQGNQITFLQQSSLSSLSISSSDEEELHERSGEPSRRRSHLAQQMHEVHDGHGQLMRWVEADGHADRPRRRYFSGRERASSTGEIDAGKHPPVTTA